MKRIADRHYQATAVDKTMEEFETGRKSTMTTMPTGTGKTVVAAKFCKRIKDLRRGNGRTLFLARRNFLVNSAGRAIRDMGLTVAVEMASERAIKANADVVVGSEQTLSGERLDEWPEDAFDAIVQDECHHAVSRSNRAIYARFPGAWHLGITATNGRSDGRNLGTVYETEAYHYNMSEAIRDKFLVPVTQQVCRTSINLKELKTTGKNGDLNSGELAERIGPYIEEMAASIIVNMSDRQVITFMPDKGTAYALSHMLSKMGMPSRYVVGDGGRWGMKKAEAKTLLKSYERLEFQSIVTCDLLEEGWDCPPVSGVVQGRATYSPWKYMQRTGRGTRPCPEVGKEDCLVLDFDWNVDESQRDLCSSVDLFSDEFSLTPQERREYKKKAREGSYADVLKSIEEAKENVRIRPHLDVPITGVQYEVQTWLRSPDRVSRSLGLTLAKIDKNLGSNPASDAQVHRLKKEGILEGCKLSRIGASKVISEIERRSKLGLCTLAQLGELIAMKVDASKAHNLTSGLAGAVIEKLRKVL
jgi:superfamily II DNA or RNA helicase